MAVEIILDEETRYRISADKYNVVLDKAYWSKSKKTWLYGSNKTYHPDFGHAVKSMAKKEMSQSALGDNQTIITLEQLSEKIQRFQDEIMLMFQQLPDEIVGDIPHKYILDEEE